MSRVLSFSTKINNPSLSIQTGMWAPLSFSKMRHKKGLLKLMCVFYFLIGRQRAASAEAAEAGWWEPNACRRTAEWLESEAERRARSWVRRRRPAGRPCPIPTTSSPGGTGSRRRAIKWVAAAAAALVARRTTTRIAAEMTTTIK